MGTTNAAQRERKWAAPKRAIAAIGVKLGGCGMSLAKAARTTNPPRAAVRVLADVLSIWIILQPFPASSPRSQGQMPEIRSQGTPLSAILLGNPSATMSQVG